MSAAAPAHPATPPPAQAGDACPLCAAPLAPDQGWCLNCGAAARTRLAATPNWRGPIAALAAVMVLSLAVLGAALVKLAGETGPSPIVMHTVTAAAAAVAPAPTGAATTPAPSASTPGAKAGTTTGAATAQHQTTGTAATPNFQTGIAKALAKLHVKPVQGLRRSHQEAVAEAERRRALEALNLSGRVKK
jgi:hypothetical protein